MIEIMSSFTVSFPLRHLFFLTNDLGSEFAAQYVTESLNSFVARQEWVKYHNYPKPQSKKTLSKIAIQKNIDLKRMTQGLILGH